jgi:peptide/nickel transport system permease protein
MSDALVAAEEAAPEAAVPGEHLARRIVSSPLTMIGLLGTLLVVSAAVFAPLVAPHEPGAQNLANILAPPIWSEGGSAEHLLGTDGLGRDVATRLLYGARNSLFIAVAAMLVGSSLGLLTGLVAGFFGGRIDAAIMRIGDVQLAFPFILLAIAILGVLPDRRPIHLILVLGIPGWIIYARVVRSRVLAEREKDYVHAARALGASRWRRLFRYVFPSVWQVVPVIALLDVGFLIIMESTLSFLGLGLPPPSATWGGILAEGRRNMVVSPWLPVLPGLAIMVTVLSINLFGDGLASVFDPRLRRGGPRRLTPPPVGQRLTAGEPDAPETAGPELADEKVPGATSIGSREVDIDRDEPAAVDPDALLSIRGLHVEFPTQTGTVHAVRGIDLDLRAGQTLGIVGESGSGKSVTASAIIQLLDPPGRVSSGTVHLDGEDLVRVSNRRMRELRGRHIGMIFQNPAASLNPVLTIGFQMRESIRHSTGKDRTAAGGLARRVLTDVGIPDPDRILRQYPFELSGGMNQRVMIAMALAARPRILLADEPTTALDTTTQAQILRRLVELTHEHDISLMLITHDIALVAQYADTVLVLYAGQVCEHGAVADVLAHPRHPYTRALLESVPHLDTVSDRLRTIPGELPDPRQPARGCPFAARCPEVMEICEEQPPADFPIEPGHGAACYLWSPELASERRS